PLVRVERAVKPQKRLLHDVLRLRHAAEHPVGDREGRRPELVEQVPVPPAHAASSAKPWRQLGWLGCQPSSRFAFAFEAPRTSVIMTVAASPASTRPSQRGTWRGGLAPRAVATSGSHTATGAGSSSTML